MNSVDKFLDKYKNMIEDMTVKQGPTSEEIYQELCSYNSTSNSLEKDVLSIVSYVDNVIKQYIGTYLNQSSGIDLVYLNKNKGQYLKYIDISFNKHLPSINEAIQLYFSVEDKHYRDFIMSLIQYLLKEKISFSTRLSKVDRNDNLIIMLYSKIDVSSVINYINSNNLLNYLRTLNPFIYQINNIGIVKDTSKISYNKYVSIIIQEYIEECILKQQQNPYTSRDLQRFGANKCTTANDCYDKIMGYNFACSLYSIITKEEILTRINDKFDIQYDSKVLSKYDCQIVKDEIKYYLNNEEVDYDTLIYLNANKCLAYMYEVKEGENPTSSYTLNSSIVNNILSDLENILSNNICNISLSFDNHNIHRLIPYLYAFLAKKYKYCNEQECQKVINFIKDKALFLDEQNDDGYKYQIKDHTLKSSIPVIQTKEGFCTIEYIDDDIVNINTIENGKINSYLNVYIDVDRDLLNDCKNYYGRLYRNSIAVALLDLERNKKALKLRENDFSSKFLVDKEEKVNKYVNVDYIKKIYHMKN